MFAEWDVALLKANRLAPSRYISSGATFPLNPGIACGAGKPFPPIILQVYAPIVGTVPNIELAPRDIVG